MWTSIKLDWLALILRDVLVDLGYDLQKLWYMENNRMLATLLVHKFIVNHCKLGTVAADNVREHKALYFKIASE